MTDEEKKAIIKLAEERDELLKERQADKEKIKELEADNYECNNIIRDYIEELKEKNKRAEELYMQHNQMIIDILKECDYMIKNRYYMNDIAIRQYAEKIKDIAKYYIKEPEWIEIEEE